MWRKIQGEAYDVESLLVIFAENDSRKIRSTSRNGIPLIFFELIREAEGRFACFSQNGRLALRTDVQLIDPRELEGGPWQTRSATRTWLPESAEKFGHCLAVGGRSSTEILARVWWRSSEFLKGEPIRREQEVSTLRVWM